MEELNDVNEIDFYEEADEGVFAKASLHEIIGTAHPSIERFRLVLLFCACMKMFGLPTAFGPYIQLIFGFAPIAFLILSGILVLADPIKRRERIVRSIKRTALAFAIMVVTYAALNLLFYYYMGIDVLPAMQAKRTWFNFIVLNTWPFDIGDAIWYVQALLYTYIIIYFLDRLKLMKFDWLIAAVLLIVTIATGELNGIVKFSFLGYNAFPSNFINRSLPYVLLGGFLGRTVSRWTFWHPIFGIAGTLLGVGAVIFEPMLLAKLGVVGYYGHLMGMGIMAVSVCILFFQHLIQRDIDEFENSSVTDFPLTRRGINFIYYLYQPLATLVGFAIAVIGVDLFSAVSDYIGLTVFFILLVAVLAVEVIRDRIKAR